MATPKAGARPGRILAAFGLVTVLLYVLIYFVAPAKVGDETVDFARSFTPLLGLDLEGGTQITLQPEVAGGSSGEITADNLDQAVEIIRKRVNSFGVSEAEVTKSSSNNIVISIPGANPDILDRVKQTAQLSFRAVLVEQAGVPVPQPSGSPGAESPASDASAGPDATAVPDATAAPGASPSAPAPAPSSSSDGRAIPQALRAATPAPSAAAPSGAAAPSSAPSVAPTAPEATPDAAADPLAAVTTAQQEAFLALDCSADEPEVGDQSDPAKPILACSTDGVAKYVLGGVTIQGTEVSDAQAGLAQTSTGAVTNRWVVNLEFTGAGTNLFTKETSRLAQQSPPQNQFAIVLDDEVVSAPSVSQTIAGGRAEISGNFNQSAAQDLANVLRYGALPLTFEAGSAQEISPELGADSLRGGLIAGGIGLALVVLYMLAYYRRLGLVAVASLVVAGILSIGLVTLLGWRIEYRLTLAGIAGLIVSIGITADSFVIYFERLRDEVREGRSIRVAVETGWRRARRTVITSDVVSLIAAVVLYFLSTSSVQGFAFTLGLTTLVDLLVIFFFTKPLVTIFGRSKKLTTGKWSGLAAERLGSAAGGSASPSLALARSRERRLAAEAGTRTAVSTATAATGKEF